MCGNAREEIQEEAYKAEWQQHHAVCFLTVGTKRLALLCHEVPMKDSTLSNKPKHISAFTQKEKWIQSA